MTITGTSPGRMEIVVMPFRAAADSAFAGTLPVQLHDLIAADLAYSGYFNVLDAADLPPDWIERVQRVGNTFDTLRTFAGSEAARVQGTLTLSWEGATADLAIFQPRIVTPMATRQFRFSTDQLRPAGHEMAGWITKTLTGEGGAFGTQIVFVVKTGNNKNLWAMDWDGANPHALTRDNTVNMSPSWGPDGRTLFFTSFRAGNADIYKYDLSSGRITSFVASPRVDSAPAVSPDGEWVAYSSASDGNAEIYRCRLDGTGRSQLTISYGIDTSPSWSPTGRDLVFTSDRTGEPQIYRMDFDGASVVRLTMAGNYNETARWSSHNMIAWASREVGFQIFTLDLSNPGTGERRVTGEGSNLDPSWSPDGMKLVYTARFGNGKSAIWTCNWDGSNARQLTFGLEASQPQWGPAMPVADQN